MMEKLQEALELLDHEPCRTMGRQWSCHDCKAEQARKKARKRALKKARRNRAALVAAARWEKE